MLIISTATWYLWYFSQPLFTDAATRETVRAPSDCRAKISTTRCSAVGGSAVMGHRMLGACRILFIPQLFVLLALLNTFQEFLSPSGKRIYRFFTWVVTHQRTVSG
ncbi:hypothetical protein OH492_20725 [Vibrio chagasii]|nr:hypothetical protein [Vibrio chagasii]